MKKLGETRRKKAVPQLVEGLSASLEDYLQVIFHLEESHLVARAKEIADQMIVQRASVTGALKALASRGLINYSPYSFSEAVFEKIARHQPVDMSEMVWVNDFELMLLGWLPTLNFPASRQAVLERKYLERLLALFPPRQGLLALGKDIHSELVTGIWGPSKIPFQVI